MRVENGNGAGSASGLGAVMSSGLLGQNEDAQSKNIRKQIEAKQQELSELSAKEDMSPEEKMKKRQELAKEISDLNMQLRRHQMELHMQEKAEKQKQSQNNRNTEAQRSGSASQGKRGAQAAGISEEGMSALLSADTSMKQAKVQGSVSNRMENRAAVLESEIKLDSARGTSTERKEAELASVEEKAVNAAVAQAGTLGDVNESVRDAAEAERAANEGHETTESAKKTNGKRTESDEENGTEKTASRSDGNENTQGIDGDDPTAEKSQSERYPSVDVRI